MSSFEAAEGEMVGQTRCVSACWNQDVREIVAEFAADDELLMCMRLLSSEWCAAVTAGLARAGVLSAVRATLCPAMVVEAPTDAAVEAIVRASIALSRCRSVDLTSFPHLQNIDLVWLFSCLKTKQLGSKSNEACLEVKLLTLTGLTMFPSGVDVSGISDRLDMVLPTTISQFPGRCFAGASFRRMDLSGSTSLVKLPFLFLCGATVAVLRDVDR